MARKSTIADLFRQSPFKLIQSHMRVVLECAQQIPPFFEAFTKNQQAAMDACQEMIFSKENEADAIKNNLREHLPKSLFMAVDRRDLLDLLQSQDAIADTAQDIVAIFMERRMELPQDMHAPMQELAAHCVEACLQCAGIIEELDELLEMGFRGREVERVEKMIEKLSNLEAETDTMGLQLARQLFSHEDNMKPVTVVMWYQVIQLTGNLADHAERVSDRLRLLIAR